MATVADIIRRDHDEIMTRWSREAHTFAAARGLSEVGLRDMMPEYLSALADQLAGVVGDDERRRRVERHLASRIREGFELAEILDEFTLLGECIASMWHGLPQSTWPPGRQIDALHQQLHRSIAQVTDAFHRHMREDEQSEKRFLRDLETIASRGLHDTARPLPERLGEVLGVVMNALEAQHAAFALFDAPTAKLVLIATAGTNAGEPYSTSLDAATFVAEIAKHQEPTALAYDGDVPALAIPRGLHAGGIHALLGVRLPGRGALLGVMYVGMTERREFAAREVRRIEALADKLAFHLESARLFGELHATIDTLQAERALRERFVSVLAHDLRGPLSAASLAAEMLRDGTVQPDLQRELAHKIAINIERIDRMTRDLLDANRIRGGEQLPLRLAECDLAAIARHVADDARDLHGDRFVVEGERELRGIWSEDELQRAVWNLVTNAVKYGADQPITVRTTRVEGGARVSVHNLGPPIPLEQQQRIFDLHARAPSAVVRDRPGWGLGLTLVRGVAEAHGGRVMLHSDAAGTTFTVEIPHDARPYQRNIADREVPEARAFPMPWPATSTRTDRRRAIVADDDPEMLEMVTRALEQLGLDTVPVSSGGDLLDQIVEDGKFDIVVTDIAMPWMTGLQVMHSVRTAGLAVPVVVMTALSDPAIPAQVASLGLRAVLLHKPFSIAQLFAAVEQSLSKERA